MKRFSFALLLTVAAFANLSAQKPQRQVAITIDDLPIAQTGARGCTWDTAPSITDRLLAPIREQHIPVTAFVIANNCSSLTLDQRRELLRKWQAAGVEIGNHTFSHPDINTTPIADYEQNILQGDAWLRETLGIPSVRYVRSPMLHIGPTPEIKKRLADFLAAHHWQQGMVTFDNADWMFAFVYNDAVARGDQALATRIRETYVPYMESVVAWFEKREVEVVGREFPQVLLMHANALNAEKFPALVAMFQRRGYSFISLEQALRDPAYSLPDGYAGTNGFSWIHRWSRAKGMSNSGEPDEPAWLSAEYAKMTAPAPVTIILVRHAEKSAPTGDVSLSDAGKARAASLAHVLADANIRYIFVTNLKRTNETATNVSNKFHVEPTVFPAADVDQLVAQLKKTPAGSTALVVGHSNTVPEIIEKLGAGVVTIADEEYDHLYVVTLEGGRARLLALRY